MKTDKRTKHKRWLYWQQAGICYLQINQACRQRQGRMWCDVADGGLVLSKSAAATFEHVVPRSKVKNTQLILLACFSCNGKKGANPASPEHLELAKDMWKRWCAYRRPERDAALARKKKRADAKTLQQQLLEEHHARRRAALGLDNLGANARAREKAINRLRESTSRALGR